MQPRPGPALVELDIFMYAKDLQKRLRVNKILVDFCVATDSYRCFWGCLDQKCKVRPA